ncbi:unnamed protein product [Aphanomyces euteiches]
MTSVGPALDDDCDEKTVATMLELPAAFVDFLNEHEIDPHVYDVDPSAMPRYFRTKDESVTEEELRKHFDQVERVPWLRCFYAIPSSVSLATSELYVGGKIYGMEASSGFAVTVLDPQPGSDDAVDFSKSRIAACRTLVHKYDLIHSPAASWRCRLFHADGRTFDVRPESNDTISALETILDSAEVAQRSQKTQTRKRMNKSARARLAKQAKDAVVALGSSVDSSALYDKVLVDAECTHDGSLRHLTKLKSDDKWTQYLTKYLNREHVQGILDLQHDLIRNGFRLLREGGRMVYSTCSLSRKQNEEIVASFLKDTPTAELVPFDTTGIPHQPGHLDHTIRFTPLENMGGLFVSLITKKPSVKRIKLSNADDV